ncbi:hypothetical protein DSM112329_00892 [Paraconexibacter sp. AEG42_29]|uniref:Transposase n=1 Tax=Paraconexibacter sp. AEG42_29 TaxID=2997339 RepID=A0AAU7AR01_9ACTN
MRTPTSPIIPSDGGAPPPVVHDGAPVDEGPMRAELLRQIRRLEIEISRFAAANCPYEDLPGSARRGPAILTTAQLEEIRDELLATRNALHEVVIAKATAKVKDSTTATSTPRRRGLRRRREG